MSHQGAKEVRILELDALRGIASLAVVFFHLNMNHSKVYPIFNLGVTGVDLFFLISGFVIFKSIENVVSWKEFAISRISRLYPTYWACVTFTFLVILANNIYHHQFDPALPYNYFFNLYMIQHFFNIPDLDGSYWTMAVELLFYVVILLIMVTKQISRMVAIGCFGLLIVAIYSFLPKKEFPLVFSSFTRFFPLIIHFPLFFAGILFYKLKGRSSSTNIYLIYAIIIICFFLQISLYSSGATNYVFVSLQEYSIMVGIYFSVFFLFINNKLKFIVTHVTLYLGTISYALYLVHEYVSLNIILPFLTVELGWFYWPSALLTALIAISLASLVTFYIEKPTGKKMKVWLTKTF